MTFTRRQMLRHAAVGAALLVPLPMQTPAGDDIQLMLDVAATAEAFACTHYYTALTDSGVQVTPAERQFLIATLDTERRHYELLLAQGAQPLTDTFYSPLNVYRNRENFSTVTEQVEAIFVGVYLAATRRAAELGDAPLAATMAQLAATEQVHLALVRQLAELLPNNTALAGGLYQNPSEALPMLQPFIDGGGDFRGPYGFPGSQALLDLIGLGGVEDVAPYWT